jgi:hypothetical protein
MIPQAFGFIGGIRVKVGTFYQGGIVVYIDRGTKQGLIAQNQYTTDGIAWGPNGAFTQTSGYGYGYQNTQNAITTLSPSSGAVYTAWNSTLNGYNDWFIPTRAEAAYIYQAKSFFSFWDGGTIWCSEFLVGVGDVNAYALSYSDGSSIIYLRNETNNRRSIACRYMNFT